MAKKNLITLIIVFIVVFVLVILNFSWLKSVYFHNNKTIIGYVINSGILIIFFAGIVKIILEFLRYIKEENAIDRFMLNIKNNVQDKLMGIDKNTLIVNRINIIKEFSKKNFKPDIKILSSFLLSSEQNRKGILEYINNILILTGVFGTVISLIISLLGASNFIKATDEKSMSLIIHGMSTALNTTFTAIFCFFIFHYFYSKLNQIQEYIALKIEEITYFHIIPEFISSEEKVYFEVDSILKEVKGTIENFTKTQEGLKEYAVKFSKLISLNYEMFRRLEKHYEELKSLIKEGFRLK